MCQPFPLLFGYRRVERTEIRLKRIHDFAAGRWLNANSVPAAKLWRGMMNACVKTTVEYVEDDALSEALKRMCRGW